MRFETADEIVILHQCNRANSAHRVVVIAAHKYAGIAIEEAV